MNELLRQGLWFTAIGMGMTFLSIGALVGGMVLLTAIFPEKRQEPSPQFPEREDKPNKPEDDRYLAAAAAVAVSLAQAQMPFATEAAGPDPWRAYVRNYHITRQSQRSSFRSRR